eukprot:11177161-Lingulodinium_polyedra.AAC.1
MPTKCLPSTRRSALRGLLRFTSLTLPETAGAVFCACCCVLTALLEHGTEVSNLTACSEVSDASSSISTTS